jgi:hypothetical protein
MRYLTTSMLIATLLAASCGNARSGLSESVTLLPAGGVATGSLQLTAMGSPGIRSISFSLNGATLGTCRGASCQGAIDTSVYPDNSALTVLATGIDARGSAVVSQARYLVNNHAGNTGKAARKDPSANVFWSAEQASADDELLKH